MLLGVSPAQASCLFIFVSLAGFVGRFVFSGLSELIGCGSRRARPAGPRVRICLPPAKSLVRTWCRCSASAARLIVAEHGAPAVHRVVRGAWLSVAVMVRRIRARNTGAHIVVDELHITGSERTTMDISPIALNHSQRRAIGFLASEYGRSLITMPYVGPKTIDALIKLGLIEIAPHNLHGEPRYGLTKAGNNMHEELSRLMLIPR